MDSEELPVCRDTPTVLACWDPTERITRLACARDLCVGKRMTKVSMTVECRYPEVARQLEQVCMPRRRGGLPLSSRNQRDDCESPPISLPHSSLISEMSTRTRSARNSNCQPHSTR
jgi:hypothetical protein